MFHLSGHWLHVEIWRKRVRTRRAGLREEIHYGFFLLGVALFWLFYVALFCWVWGCCVAGFSVVLWGLAWFCYAGFSFALPALALLCWLSLCFAGLGERALVWWVEAAQWAQRVTPLAKKIAETMPGKPMLLNHKGVPCIMHLMDPCSCVHITLRARHEK